MDASHVQKCAVHVRRNKSEGEMIKLWIPKVQKRPITELRLKHSRQLEALQVLGQFGTNSKGEFEFAPPAGQFSKGS